MKVIQCPEVYKEEDSNIDDISIFVAGGISGCGNWQKEMIDRFKAHSDQLVLINPRREDFDITDPTMSAKQIEWEYDHLERAAAVLFWFPFATLCPITLFELGVQSMTGKRIFVGCHPAYQRKFDVEKQLSLSSPHVKVHDNFADMVTEINAWIEKLRVDFES